MAKQKTSKVAQPRTQQCFNCNGTLQLRYGTPQEMGCDEYKAGEPSQPWAVCNRCGSLWPLMPLVGDNESDSVVLVRRVDGYCIIDAADTGDLARLAAWLGCEPQKLAQWHDNGEFDVWVQTNWPGEVPKPACEVAPKLPPRTMAELAREAIEVQNGCNPLGLSKAYAAALDNLWAILSLECNAVGEQVNGFAQLEQHPINRLWLSKLYDMAGMETDCKTQSELLYQCRQLGDWQGE